MGPRNVSRRPQPRYYALEVKSVLEFAGDPTLAAAVGIDLTALDDPETAIPLSKYYDLLERAAAVTANPHFGCHFARHWHRGVAGRERGALGLLIASSPSLRVMCEQLVRFQRYWNSGDRYEAEERGPEVAIRYRPWGPRREAHRHMAEKTITDIVAVIRAVDPTFEPLRLSFPHGPNGGPCKLERFIRVRPTYGAETTEIVLPAGVLDLPLPTADRSLFRLSERYLALRFAELPAERDGWAARVRDAAQRALVVGRCDQQSVARALGCTARTLQRRLAEESTSLREIVDEIRKHRARALLETGASVADVGFQLGYSEPAAFQHAFRRWYGESPKAWAAQNARGADG